MPTMMEIYKNYSTNYDELIQAEDYNKELEKYLHENIYWNDKIVYEAGIGTGRVTKIFINKVKHVYGFDREQNMLNKCKENLINYKNLSLGLCENTELKIISETADIFIEGWSFGHTIIENKDNYQSVFKGIFNQIIKILKGTGQIIIIESCGTNVSEPRIKSPVLEEYYKFLEEKYNFKKTIISTDYRFKNCDEASRIMGFFFGREMSDEILQAGNNIIPEFTGIWLKDNN